MVAEEDPWEESLRRLGGPRARWLVPSHLFAVHWDPVGTANPRRRDGMNFSDHEAVAFVKRHLRGALEGPADRYLRRRLEVFRQDPQFTAMVLEIGGKYWHPPVYAKWVLSPEPLLPAVWFVSFHSSVRLSR